MNKYILFFISLYFLVSCKTADKKLEFKYNVNITKINTDLKKIDNYFNNNNAYVLYFTLSSKTDKIHFSFTSSYINKDYLENIVFPVNLIIEKGIYTNKLSDKTYIFTEIFRNYSIDSVPNNDFYLNTKSNDILKSLSKGIYRIIISSQNKNDYKINLKIGCNYQIKIFDNYTDALKSMTDKIE